MRNYTVAEIWGIPIRVNTSLLVFLPILAWLIGSGQQIELYAGLIEGLGGVQFDVARLRAGNTPWVIGLAAAVGLFVSVTVHELGHSWVALRYGIEIESITLWILGGMAALKTIPREWQREFWIAIAGPITSVLLGAVIYVAMLAIANSFQVLGFVLGWLALVNVILAAFNLLPAFPMDGGRIFRALLARNRPYATATRIAGRVGVIFAFLFAIVGVLNFQVILLLLAFFIYGAATTESRTVLLDELLDGITVSDIMTREPATVHGETTIEEYGVQMLRDRQTVHLVTDDDGSIRGVVSLDDVQKVKKGERGTTAVEDVMTREVPTVALGDDAFDTLAFLQQADNDSAFVEIEPGLTGLLTQADYSRAISFRRGFASGPPVR
ncbi:MAG: site-2 protease family protein [Halobacteriales archaeon]|nr:site-2 protease family protein [Halobacteriales archaeon]